MRFVKKALKIGVLLFVFVFLIASVLPYFFSIETKELALGQKPFPNSYFIKVNNTRIHYRVWIPKGKIKHKALFIHGFSGSSFSYRKNIDTLLDLGTLVIAIDLPAFGFSDKSDGANYSLDNTCLAITRIITKYDATCSEKFLLIGHSMGASLAGIYASNFRRNIKALVLIDGIPFQNQMNIIVRTFLNYPPLLRWANVLTKHYFAKTNRFDQLLSSAYAAPADSSSINGYLQPFMYKNSGSAILKMFTTKSTLIFNVDTFKKIPLLIIWGQQDTWIPISACKKFTERFPKARTKLISNAGHCPMETCALEVNGFIADFMIE